MYFPALDALRGMAACLIVLYHSPFFWGGGLSRWSTHLFLFVDFFFCLSGFVMAHAYEARIASGLSLGRFVLLRLARLYPLHIVTLLCWVPYVAAKNQLSVGLAVSGQAAGNNLETFLYQFFLVNAFGITDQLTWNPPSWSIGAEFYTYLIFYAFCVTIDRGRTIFLPIVIAAATYAGIVISSPSFLGDMNRTFDLGFFRCLAGFYLGVAVYRARRLQRRPCSGSIGVIALIICVSLVIASAKEPRLSLGAVLSFPILIWAIASSHEDAFSRMLGSALLQNIGAWSYSIYMVHYLLLMVVFNFALHFLRLPVDEGIGVYSILINMFMLASVVLISSQTYRFIEKPAQQLFRSFSCPARVPILRRKRG